MKYPCTVCSKPVKVNQLGIQCSECDKWTHAKCCGVSVSEYEHLSTQSDDWLCRRCPLSELSFYDSAYENSEHSQSLLAHDSPTDSEPLNSSMLNIQTNNTVVTIAHLNITSILPKLDILRNSFSVSSIRNPFPILTLSETWLNNDISDHQIEIKRIQKIKS